MNLKELFGKKYRVTLDESWEHEKEEGKRLHEWRYHEIRGKHGKIYLYSVDQIACIFNSIIIANRFSIKGWKVIQNGDFEQNILIPNENIDEVLKAIKPKRRRQISEEQKKVLVDQLRQAKLPKKLP